MLGYALGGMNTFVGLVVRSQFQQVHAKTNMGKIGLFQLSMVSSESLEGRSDLVKFKVWGNIGMDKLRYRICRGSIVVIEEHERQKARYGNVNAADEEVLVGNLIAYTDINSQEVVMLETHPSISCDFLLRANISTAVAQFHTDILRHNQWSMLRSCVMKSARKADLHLMFQDTNTVLFDLSVRLSLQPLFTLSDDIRIVDIEGSFAYIDFQHCENRKQFVDAVSFALQSIPCLQHLGDLLAKFNEQQSKCDSYELEEIISTIYNQIVNTSHSLLLQKIDFPPNPLSSYFLNIELGNVAVSSSYQQQIVSLRFLPHCTTVQITGKFDKPVNAALQHQSNKSLEPPIQDGTERIKQNMYEEVPDISFYSWESLQKLLASFTRTLSPNNDNCDYADGSDRLPCPEGFIAFCAFIKGVQFQGNDKNTFHHNFFVPATVENGFQNCSDNWRYHDAVLILSPTSNAAQLQSQDSLFCSKLEIAKYEATLSEAVYRKFMSVSNEADEQVRLATQVPFTFQSYQSSLKPIERGAALNPSVNEFLNSVPSERSIRPKDIVFAIVQFYLSRLNFDKRTEEAILPAQDDYSRISEAGMDDSSHYTNYLFTHSAQLNSQRTKMLLSEETSIVPKHSDSENMVGRYGKRKAYVEDNGYTSHTIESDDENNSSQKVSRQRNSIWHFSVPSIVPSQNVTNWEDSKSSAKMKEIFPIESSYSHIQIERTQVSCNLNPPNDSFEQPAEFNLPVLMSHEFLQNRLFNGISPRLVALDMLRQEQSKHFIKPESLNSDSNSVGCLPYLDHCGKQLQKIQSLGNACSIDSGNVSSILPCIVVCKFLPIVEEDGDYTGDLLLSLEDII